MCAIYVQCRRRPEEKIGSPRTELRSVCEPNLSLTLLTSASAVGGSLTWKPWPKASHWVWVLGIKLRFSEKHQLFSIAELSLQPKAISFYLKKRLPCQVWDTVMLSTLRF